MLYVILTQLRGFWLLCHIYIEALRKAFKSHRVYPWAGLHCDSSPHRSLLQPLFIMFTSADGHVDCDSVSLLIAFKYIVGLIFLFIVWNFLYSCLTYWVWPVEKMLTAWSPDYYTWTPSQVAYIWASWQEYQLFVLPPNGVSCLVRVVHTKVFISVCGYHRHPVQDPLEYTHFGSGDQPGGCMGTHEAKKPFILHTLGTSKASQLMQLLPSYSINLLFKEKLSIKTKIFNNNI